MTNYFSEIMGSVPFKNTSRKWHIINTTIDLLEELPYSPVTTARLAGRIGISEAALYKHFPSKDSIFRTITSLTESLVFHHLGRVVTTRHSALFRLRKAADTWIFLAETCPGLALILSAFALSGTCEPLMIQHARFCERFEAELKNLLTEAVNQDGVALSLSRTAAAQWIMSWLEGKVWQFVRSGFILEPSRHREENWKVMIKAMTLP